MAASSGHPIDQDPALRRLATEMADYLLFAGEAPPLSELTPRPGFAASLAARTPPDHLGRSLGQLDLIDRLLRYPCSFMVYSDAFEGLPAAIKRIVYQRMIASLSAVDPHTRRGRIVSVTRGEQPSRSSLRPSRTFLGSNPKFRSFVSRSQHNRLQVLFESVGH